MKQRIFTFLADSYANLLRHTQKNNFYINAGHRFIAFEHQHGAE